MVGKGLHKIIYNFDPSVQAAFHQVKYIGSDKTETALTTESNIVGEGTAVARVIDFDDEEFKSDNPEMEDLPSDPQSFESEYVYYNIKTKEFISKAYGFVVLKDKKIKILPLVEYSEDKLYCYLYAYKTSNMKLPSKSDIGKIIDKEKIIHIVDDYFLTKELEGLEKDPNRRGGKILIAEGAVPVDGVVEKIELRKSLERNVGKELEDGRIDYKEKNFFYTVTKGELIAEKIPKVPPRDGVDVLGTNIPGKLTGVSAYKIGTHLEEEFTGSNLYVSMIDGVLEITEDGKLNIEERLVVPGNVNMTTGHINFPGIVEIRGSVLPGFKVEADKDIFIEGNIEDAYVRSNGKIVVQTGILGKESCEVRAAGGIKARFIQNASVYSEKNIEITESIIQGKCFAKEFINIGGHVIGGEIIACFGIKANVVGSPSETKTILIVGKDPDAEKQMEQLSYEIDEGLKKLREQLDEIIQYFGENILADFKNIVPTLPAHRKKQCLTLLKAIQELNKSLSDKKTNREAIKNALVFPEPPTIAILDTAHPGVRVQIKNSIKKLDTAFNSKVTFKEDTKLKVIYWE